MLDVKAYCTRSGYRFFAQMARDDSGQSSGLIKRETFVSKMKMILSDNPNMINFLANHYNANSSVMVNYKKMNDDIHSLDDSETASSNSAIKIAILKYKHKEQKTFKELFDQFSVQKQMDSTRLEQLLEKAGFSNMNKEFVKNYITTFNKKSGNYLTYFQFVSSFDVSDQRPEFALLLRNHIALWQELKKIVLDKYNQSLSQSFDNCRTTLAMVQEMERLPGVSSKHVELMQFAAIFEDAIVPEKLDKFGLRLVEEVLGMDVKQSLPPEKPITTDTHLLVPGTKLTFKKLKGIKSFVAFLQEDAKQLHKTDCLAIFKRYDKDNAGKLSHAVFMKMLYDDYEQDTDPKTNPSLQKMMDQVKEYCGDDKSNYDYIKLCSLLGEDVEKKESTTRFEVEKEYAQQTLPPSLTDAEHEKKITEGAKPSEPAVTKDLTLKQAIRRHYSLIPMTKDAIIKHLVPNDRFVNIDDFRKTINKDMKTVDPAELTNYIHELAGENKMIEMKTLRDSLFPDLVTGKDLKSVGFEEQIDQVFSDLDIEQKNAIDKVKMTLGCKSLGLNLSPAELEKLFNQFKHHDSMFMDRNGFSRMVKYEYCKDISKNRLVIDRLDHLIPLIDPHRKGKINEDQLRCLFAKLGAVPTPEEIKAILIVCDVENKEGASAKVSIQKLRELVSQSIITFDPRKEDLNNALVKIRSKLSTNLLEQYNGFKFMPSNYMSSFTEDLYLSSNACWPTSVLKPQLADSRSYYTNLEAPNSGEVRQQQRVNSVNVSLVDM